MDDRTSNRKTVPDFFGRLYPDDLHNGSFLGTWVRRAEVDALLDEIERLRDEGYQDQQRLFHLESALAKHSSHETTSEVPWPRCTACGGQLERISPGHYKCAVCSITAVEPS
jgi:hypothetical protein